MDCADTFNKRLEKLGLPALVQTQLKLREFTTAASPYCALSMGAEEAFEVILKDGSVEAGSAPNLLSTPTAGKLRRRNAKSCVKLRARRRPPQSWRCRLFLLTTSCGALTWGLSFPQSPWPSFGMILPKTTLLGCAVDSPRTKN